MEERGWEVGLLLLVVRFMVQVNQPAPAHIVAVQLPTNGVLRVKSCSRGPLSAGR